MFGIDLGISISSVSLVTQQGKVIDYQIIFGDKRDKNEWRRIRNMADAITRAIDTIIRSHPEIVIEQHVAIEEPVYPWRTKNPRSFFVMSCLYALVRNRLAAWHYNIYSINPVSVKSTAKHLAFPKVKRLKSKYAVRGRLTKKGMVRAYKKLVGHEPKYSNAVGRETMADSYFIAWVGIERRKVGVR